MASVTDFPDPKRYPDVKKSLMNSEETCQFAKPMEKYLQKLEIAKRKYAGESIELQLYRELKKYFATTSEPVCVFQRYYASELNFAQNSDKNVKEKDFVIINPLRRCIISIECKQTLGAGESISSVIDQLNGMKESFESWFSRDLYDQEWKFVPMVYCHYIKMTCKNINNNNMHILKGMLHVTTGC